MTHLPNASKAKRQRSNIAALIRLLDDATIGELLRRAEHPNVDPWPPQTGQPGGSNDVARPVEAVTVRDAGGRIITHPDGTEECTPDAWAGAPDNVRDAIAELFAELAEADGLLESIDQRRQWLLHIHESARKRTNSVDQCTGCRKPIIPPQRTKRLDGQPYHHPDPIDGEAQPQCWWTAYRARPGGEEAC